MTWVIVRKLKDQRHELNRMYSITFGGEKLADDDDDDDNAGESNKDDEVKNNDWRNENIVDVNNSKAVYESK